MTPAAMTEEQLTEAIESTLAAAHIVCQFALQAGRRRPPSGSARWRKESGSGPSA
jgi:hypothetical protein